MNPLATSFELVHYLSIARPTILAVDPDLLPNAVKALEGLPFKSPQLLIIENEAFQQSLSDFPTVSAFSLLASSMSNYISFLNSSSTTAMNRPLPIVQDLETTRIFPL
jgi:hypothetical protein